MNRLSIEKRLQIIKMLVEGSSLIETSKICNVSINTVIKLLVDVGQACQKFHDESVTGIYSKRIQCIEVWSFVNSKDKNTPAEMENKVTDDDMWTWVGINTDTKLVISFFVGKRDANSANVFIQDVASRLKSKLKLTKDAHKVYLDSVDNTFDNDVNFAQLVEIYGSLKEDHINVKKNNPAECNGERKVIVQGHTDKKNVSAFYKDCQNLTVSMNINSLPRLTNAFSKKAVNHFNAIALHFVYYNFCKVHKTLRVTPAQEAGLTHRVMSIQDLVNLVEK